jgi:hypothetical protein
MTMGNKRLCTSYKWRYCKLIKTVEANFIFNTTGNLSNVSKSVSTTVDEDVYCRKNIGKNMSLLYKDKVILCLPKSSEVPNQLLLKMCIKWP